MEMLAATKNNGSGTLSSVKVGSPKIRLSLSIMVGRRCVQHSLLPSSKISEAGRLLVPARSVGKTRLCRLHMRGQIAPQWDGRWSGS